MRIAKMMPYKIRGGEWVYPDMDEARERAGLYTIEHHVLKRQKRIVDYIATRPIWTHVLEAVRHPGTPPQVKYWWEIAGKAPKSKIRSILEDETGML